MAKLQLGCRSELIVTGTVSRPSLRSNATIGGPRLIWEDIGCSWGDAPETELHFDMLERAMAGLQLQRVGISAVHIRSVRLLGTYEQPEFRAGVTGLTYRVLPTGSILPSGQTVWVRRRDATPLRSQSHVYREALGLPASIGIPRSQPRIVGRDFTGAWQSSVGQLILTHRNPIVTGRYDGFRGSLSGMSNGNLVLFDWQYGQRCGRGFFRLTDDDRLEGRWGDHVDRTEGGRFNAHREAAVRRSTSCARSG